MRTRFKRPVLLGYSEQEGDVAGKISRGQITQAPRKLLK